MKPVPALTGLIYSSTCVNAMFLKQALTLTCVFFAYTHQNVNSCVHLNHLLESLWVVMFSSSNKQSRFFFFSITNHQGVSGTGADPGPHRVKGIQSIMGKCALLFNASTTMASLLVQILITSCVLPLRGLSSGSRRLSLCLCYKLQGEPPKETLCPCVFVNRTVSARARAGSINISL